MKLECDVKPSVDCSDGNGEYFVRLSEDDQKKANVWGEDYVAVFGTKYLPGKKNREDDPLAPPVTIAALRSANRTEPVEGGNCHIDMRLRDAIGVDIGGKVSIEALTRNRSNQIAPCCVSKLLGFQWVVCRVLKAFGDDMETPVCRAYSHVLQLLGIPEGGMVQIESVHGGVRRRLLPLSEQQVSGETKQQLHSYSIFDEIGALVDFDNYLGLDQDRSVAQIHIDHETRKALKARPGDPVWVRRDPREIVFKGISKHGAALMLATLGIVLKGTTSWVLIVPLVILTTIYILEVRSQVR